MKRTLDTTNMEQAEFAGVEHEGDPGQWVCIAKAWNKSEGWMKSTKVLEVPGAGVFLQVTTKEGGAIAEAVAFAPAIRLSEDKLSLVSDFDEEDSDGLPDGFVFRIDQEADKIIICAVYHSEVVASHVFYREDLRTTDEGMIEVVRGLLDDVQRMMAANYRLWVEFDDLSSCLIAEIDAVG